MEYFTQHPHVHTLQTNIQNLTNTYKELATVKTKELTKRTLRQLNRKFNRTFESANGTILRLANWAEEHLHLHNKTKQERRELREQINQMESEGNVPSA